MNTQTTVGEVFTNMTDFNLGDIPDLSGIQEERTEPFADGWYKGTVLAKREFTDSNGNDRVFESSDTPAQSSDSRNIRLQVEIKRRSDGRVLNASALINYRPTDLTVETVRAVAAQHEKVKESGEDWGPLFRSFMTLTRLSKLQKIAGVRSLQRNGDGGLDLTPVYGKTAYFRLRDDQRNPKYKEIHDFREDAPKSVL